VAPVCEQFVKWAVDLADSSIVTVS